MFKIFSLFYCASLCSGTAIPPPFSLEDKIGQLLMVHFQGEAPNEEARILIQDVKVGGIIYYNWANGLHSPQQVEALSSGLQKLGEKNQHPIPVLIAIDQEGGVVARLTNGFTEFPGNRALGETGQPSLAKAAALAIGRELHFAGIHMNLAPVVDVNSNPSNPIIGVRSFGENPETVVSFAEKALLGYREAGIASVLKHFPGHGDTELDSHTDLPVVRKSLQEMEKMELLPFRRLSPIAPVVMTAHLLVPAFDENECSTLSKKTLSYLRNQMGFEGLIMSDSLVMQGALKKCKTVDEAALQALNAGCDILLLGGRQLVGEENVQLSAIDIQRIHSYLVQGVREHRISEERVNEAFDRVLALKKRYIASERESELLREPIDPSVHREMARQIASSGLKTIRKEGVFIGNLRDKKIALFAPEVLKKKIDSTSLLRIGKKTRTWFFGNLDPSIAEIENGQKNIGEAEVLLICSYNGWKHPGQQALIQKLIASGKPAILICTRDSLDASLFSQAKLIINTFSPTVCSIEAVSRQLENM